MKTALFLTCAGLVCLRDLPAQSPFTVVTESSLSSAIQWNADAMVDAIRCDRTSGMLTILVQQGDGSFLAESLASGVTGTSALAVGSFSGAAPQQVALTAPGHNRVDLLPSRTSLAHAGIGADLLVATPIGGPGDDPASLDLLVGSIWNDAPATNHLDLLRPDNSLVTHGPSDTRHRLGNSFRFGLAGVPMAAALTDDAFRVFTCATGEPVLETSVAGLPSNAEWAWMVNATDTSILLVHSGGSDFQSHLASIAPLFDAPTTWPLAQSVRQLFRVELAGGDRLGVIYADGSAEIFDFDGITAPVSVATMAPPPGENFDALLALGAGDFLLLSPNAWQRHNSGPGGYTLVHQGQLPPSGASALVANRPNLFFFSNAPFVSNSPGYQQSQRRSEWTNDSGALVAGARTLPTESLGSESQGLVSAASVDVNEPSSTYVLANQYLPDLSFHGIGPVEACPRATVVFSPAPGIFAPPPAAAPETDPAELPLAAVSVVIQAQPANGHSLSYRLDDGPWIIAEGPVKITATSTLQAYAENTVTGQRSRIASAVYTVAAPEALGIPPSPDVNGNGLADAWEQTFGITDPNADADADGQNNITEQNNGTDPLTPENSEAPAPALELDLALQPGGQIHLSWPADLGPITVWWSENLVDWFPVTPAPVGNSHTEATSEARRFFKLTRP